MGGRSGRTARRLSRTAVTRSWGGHGCVRRRLIRRRVPRNATPEAKRPAAVAATGHCLSGPEMGAPAWLAGSAGEWLDSVVVVEVGVGPGGAWV